MAIGTTAAILGAAAIGAGATVMGSRSQSKAAGRAADASNQANQLQYQLGQQSIGLNRDIYNANYATLSPFVSRGNVAGDAINALLGLPAAPAMASPLAGAGGSGGSGSYSSGQMSAGSLPYGGSAPRNLVEGVRAILGRDAAIPTGIGRPSEIAGAGGATLGGYSGGYSAPAQTQGWREAPVTASNAEASAPASGGMSADQAFRNFANSAGMQFQLEQGANAINNLYAARGALQSGKAMKAMDDFAQDTALNRYFMPYMGLLGNQQAVGAGSASSIAGVGTNFGNTVANINQGIGNAASANAGRLGSIYAMQGNNQANMWNNLGSSFGTALGAISGGFGNYGGATTPINVTSTGNFRGWI